MSGDVSLGPPRYQREEFTSVRGAEAAAVVEGRLPRMWLRRWAENAGVPPRPLRTKLDDTFLEHATSWLAAADRGGSMLLAGGPGVGKTALAVRALLRFGYHGTCWRPNQKQPPPPELVGTYYTFPSVCFVTASTLYDAVFAKSNGVLDRAERSTLLVVDDWGAQYEHEWPLAKMDALIDARWSHLRPTIVTTNIYPDEETGGGRGESLEAVYPRIFSRLTDRDGPGVVVLRGPDRRQER